MSAINQSTILGRTGLSLPTMSSISGTPYVMTMETLLASNAYIIQKENADKSLLSQLVTPDSKSLTPAFINWTSLGFPNIYILFKIELSPPNVCADGVIRTIYDYVSYLLGKDLGLQVQTFQANFLDMTMSYTIIGNTLNIHVSKI